MKPENQRVLQEQNSHDFPILFAQQNSRAGDLAYNFAQVQQTLAQASSHELVIFSELFLTGAPLLDLVKRPEFKVQTEQYLNKLAQLSETKNFVIGSVYYEADTCFNALLYFSRGKIKNVYRKQCLSESGLFNEPLYFKTGCEPVVIEFYHQRFALLLGEEYLSSQVLQGYKKQLFEAFIVCQRLPYHLSWAQNRQQALQQAAQQTGKRFICINSLGGEGEAIFVGCSCYVLATGEMSIQLPHCQAIHYRLGEPLVAQKSLIPPPKLSARYSFIQIEQTYQALVLSLKDYVEKNGFPHVVLGLSGGIDSALALAIAVDAVGPEHVTAIMMPYKYTAEISQLDAQAQAQNLGCTYEVISIAPMVEVFLQQLGGYLGEASMPGDTTEQNIQARSRGMILMSFSNRFGGLLLTTSNKSELAVGYCTLYGDMCGGFAPLKDVPKTLVYALSKYRNLLGTCIPERVITRPPSAELAPNQVDLDNLPDYDILDGVIEGYIEQEYSLEMLAKQGYDTKVLQRVVQLIERNEYKRQQSALGPKITSRNFHADRPMPVSHGFRSSV